MKKFAVLTCFPLLWTYTQKYQGKPLPTSVEIVRRLSLRVPGDSEIFDSLFPLCAVTSSEHNDSNYSTLPPPHRCTVLLIL